MNIIEAMFTWWNEAMKDPEGFTAEGFARFFTEDAHLIVNGALRSQTLPDMAAHYRRIQAMEGDVSMALPVDDAFETDDRAFVHCRTLIDLDGVVKEEEAMAFAKIVDGRMSMLRVVAAK